MKSKAHLEFFELLKLSGIDELYDNIPTPAHVNEKAGDLLQKKQDLYKNCQKCPLASGRTSFVYGAGAADTDIMIVGEGPGAEEDKLGLPFVGQAGQLLTKMLAAIQINREDIYITNIVKCRPPDNRNPAASEAEACLPYLIEQIDMIKPRVILLLGKQACLRLLKEEITLAAYREKTHIYRGIKVFATYHPAALLRHPAWKRPAWEDLKKFKHWIDNN